MPDTSLDKLKQLFSENKNQEVDKSAETGGFAPIPEGYHLCELEDIILEENKKSLEAGNPYYQFKMTFVIVENDTLKNRKIFKYYPLKDGPGLLTAKNDIAKFEDEDNESIIPIEAMEDFDILVEALDLIIGKRIYMRADKPSANGNQWFSIVAWNKIAQLEEKGLLN